MWKVIKPVAIVLSVAISIVLIPYLIGKSILLYRKIRIHLLLWENKTYFSKIKQKTCLISEYTSCLKNFWLKIFLSEFKKYVQDEKAKEIKRLCRVFQKKNQKCQNHSANIIETSILIEEILELIGLIEKNKQKMYQTARLSNLPIVRFTRKIDKL